jgi:hypothetical protein
MASFNVPSRIVTKQVADGNIVVIQTAAASAMSTIDPNALEILDIQAKWASDALKNRLNCDSHKLIAALRRLELANLEVARRAAGGVWPRRRGVLSRQPRAAVRVGTVSGLVLHHVWGTSKPG